MSGTTKIAPARLARWVLTGAAMDAVAFVGVWVLLIVLRPRYRIGALWLEAVGLVAVPWAVHVVALPCVMGVARIRLGPVLRTPLFLGIAALLIPVGGFFVFWFTVLAALVATKAIAPGLAGARSHGWAVEAEGIAVLMYTATVVGAVIGLVLNQLRRGLTGDEPQALPYPRLRSDVLGGASAAGLTFGGVFAATASGALDRPVTTLDTWTLAQAPQILTMLVVCVLGLLPHLYLVGRDTLGAAAGAPQEG